MPDEGIDKLTSGDGHLQDMLPHWAESAKRELCDMAAVKLTQVVRLYGVGRRWPALSAWMAHIWSQRAIAGSIRHHRC
jgi:hypothetical protein